MTVKMTKAILIASASMFTTATIADDHKADNIPPMFAELDTNSDLIVSHAEAVAKAQAKFNEFDKNGDGFLELSELPKLMPESEERQRRMEARMEKRKIKMAKRAAEKAAKSDKSAEEIHTEMQERHAKRHAKHMEKMEKKAKTRIQFIAKLDKDKDERVSFDEFSKKAIKRFKKVDRNGDGEISVAEAKKAHKRMMRKHHGEKGERGKPHAKHADRQRG